MKITTGQVGQAVSLGQGASGGASSNFGDVLRKAAEEGAQALQKAEGTSRSAAMGTADLTDVATSISRAEVMLESLVTIRDKVVSVYNDIIRTPI
jgi:flagellar hook-basal body complex protein FliE